MEVGGGSPGDLLRGQGHRLAFDMPAKVWMQTEANGGVVVLYGIQRLDDLNVDRKLLSQLAGEALLARFARLKLSAGKLPAAPEGIRGAALADEHLVMPADQSDDDIHFPHEVDQINWIQATLRRWGTSFYDPRAFVRI